MPVIGFDRKIDVRLKRFVYNEIKRTVALKPEKYFSESHFVRCAIAKLLREEVKK